MDVRLVHRRKLVLREEGPGSIVKKLHDNDMADQARNGVIRYKLVLKEDYQELLNRSADSVQLSVSLSVE